MDAQLWPVMSVSPDSSHWHRHYWQWSRLRPPLRPTVAVVEWIGAAIAGRDDRVLLLGVTRELSVLGRELVAVDKNAMMVGHIWPGDTPSRHAMAGNWRALPFPDGHLTAVIGDGSLNAIAFPHDHAEVLAEVARVLRPSGVFAVRLFAAPAQPESVAAVIDAATARRIELFDAFKWRLAMAVANPNVSVAGLLSVFNDAVPDRDAFAAQCGWERADIDTIDVYGGSSETYCFPTAAAMADRFPQALAVAKLELVGGYELAERCPLMIATLGA
jgi:SAM-dependent methyltransferase